MGLNWSSNKSRCLLYRIIRKFIDATCKNHKTIRARSKIHEPNREFYNENDTKREIHEFIDATCKNHKTIRTRSKIRKIIHARSKMHDSNCKICNEHHVNCKNHVFTDATCKMPKIIRARSKMHEPNREICHEIHILSIFAARASPARMPALARGLSLLLNKTHFFGVCRRFPVVGSAFGLALLAQPSASLVQSRAHWCYM